MSHFVGLVFGFDHEELLEPYDENREVDVYVKYTKDEAVNVVRTKRIEDYEWALKVLEKHPNPDSKWDWYIEGGRWGEWLLLKEKDENGEPLTAICY